MMALSAQQLELLQQTEELLRSQQTGIAAQHGVSFDIIESTFPEEEPGVPRTQVRFIWDQDTSKYRVQIPT